MPKIKVSALSPVARTLLIPLAYRAIESRRPDAILRDDRAVELMQQFDEDFTRLVARAGMDQTCTMMRARQFDRYALDFLKEHPQGTVVDIGCGLDTRFYRIDNGQMSWIGLDLPEVMEARYPLLPETRRGRLICRSVMDFGWMDEVNPPAIFLAEGVLPYLEEKDVKSLLSELSRRFPGAELIFDAINSLSIKIHRFDPAVRKTLVQIRWGLDDCKTLESWGVGIRVLEEWQYFNHNEPRLGKYNLMRFLSPFAKANRILRCQVGI